MNRSKPVLLKVLHSDYIKYRKSLIVWITLIYPFCAAALVFIINFGMEDVPDNPIFEFSRALLLVSSFFLPFYLALLVTQINFTENRIEGWKLLYAQPVSRLAYFISKVLIILLACIAAYLLLYIFSLMALQVLHWHNSNIIIENIHENLKPAFLKIFEVFISASLMISIQYYLSLRLRNFILPLGIGIGATILPVAVFITLGIAGIIQSQEILSGILRYDPYTLPFSFVFDFAAFTNANYLGGIPSLYIFLSVGLACVVYILTYFDQRRRNIT